MKIEAAEKQVGKQKTKKHHHIKKIHFLVASTFSQCTKNCHLRSPDQQSVRAINISGDWHPIMGQGLGFGEVSLRQVIIKA